MAAWQLAFVVAAECQSMWDRYFPRNTPVVTLPDELSANGPLPDFAASRTKQAGITTVLPLAAC